jgi:hypothetical protein
LHACVTACLAGSQSASWPVIRLPQLLLCKGQIASIGCVTVCSAFRLRCRHPTPPAVLLVSVYAFGVHGFTQSALRVLPWRRRRAVAATAADSCRSSICGCCCCPAAVPAKHAGAAAAVAVASCCRFNCFCCCCCCHRCRSPHRSHGSCAACCVWRTVMPECPTTIDGHPLLQSGTFQAHNVPLRGAGWLPACSQFGTLPPLQDG